MAHSELLIYHPATSMACLSEDQDWVGRLAEKTPGQQHLGVKILLSGFSNKFSGA